MVKGLLSFALALTTVTTLPAAAAPSPARTARAMYTDARDREEAVRAAMTAPEALATILIDARGVIAAYEALVHRYPASGYSDDALWNAGELALDAYRRFGQPQDRDSAERLLKKLAASYPSSKFAKQVREQLVSVEPARPSETAARQAAQNATAASGRADPKLVTIRDIRRTVSAQAVRITIDLDGEATFHDERIADPDRVFLDLPGTRAARPLVDKTLRFESDDDIVRQVRVGRHPNSTTRVVLDATGVGSYSIASLTSPNRLVIECVRTQEVKLTGGTAPVAPALRTSAEKEPPRLPAHPLTRDWIKAFPQGFPRASARIASARAAMKAAATTAASPLPLVAATAGVEPAPTAMVTAPAAPTTPTATVVTPPQRNATGGVSMARQLGLGVSRIVIDPGHGGHDPGARGRGVTEAELVLDVSVRLQKLLEKAGIEVILTRTGDEFVPLQERPAIANRENADLFLSIHANASPAAAARGIETYFLNFANNPNAAQVAARENAASALSMGTLPDMVKAIALNNKVDESRDFAAHVQHAMVDRLRTTNKTLKDLGVKQAPFIVLIGATMPSVLAEISFVTNPQEAKLLKSTAYRQKIADALFNAIRKYQTSLKGVQTVAHQ